MTHDPLYSRLPQPYHPPLRRRPTEAGERFRAAVLAQDSARLRRSFRSAYSNPSPAAAGAPAAATAAALDVEVAHAFWEVLSYSQLLEDGGIEAAFREALAKVRAVFRRSPARAVIYIHISIFIYMCNLGVEAILERKKKPYLKSRHRRNFSRAMIGFGSQSRVALRGFSRHRRSTALQ